LKPEQVGFVIIISIENKNRQTDSLKKCHVFLYNVPAED